MAKLLKVVKEIPVLVRGDLGVLTRSPSVFLHNHLQSMINLAYSSESRELRTGLNLPCDIPDFEQLEMQDRARTLVWFFYGTKNCKILRKFAI